MPGERILHTHLHLKGWSWKRRRVRRRIRADGARRPAPPPPRARPAACSWSPPARRPFGSSVRARGPARPAAEGEGGRSIPPPSLRWPPARLGWAACESHLEAKGGIHIYFHPRETAPTLDLTQPKNPAIAKFVFLSEFEDGWRSTPEMSTQKTVVTEPKRSIPVAPLRDVNIFV